MKTIVVLVRKADIKKDVAREVAYVAAHQSTPEADIYNKVRLVKEDDEWMETEFDKTLTALFSQLSPWLRDFVPSLDMLLCVPLNFDMAQHMVLRKLVNDFVMNTMTSEWFALFAGMEAEVKKYDDRASSQMELIRQALMKRVRPIQPLYDEEHNIIARKKHPEQ